MNTYLDEEDIESYIKIMSHCHQLYQEGVLHDHESFDDIKASLCRFIEHILDISNQAFSLFVQNSDLFQYALDYIKEYSDQDYKDLSDSESNVIISGSHLF